MTSAVRVRSGHGPWGSWETALALPHPRLRPGVLSYRGIRLAMDRPRRRLEVPIGAATLLLGFEHPVRISRAGRPPDTLVSVYCGPTTTPAVGEHGGRLSGIEVLLTPWAAFTLFGTPQYELADRTVDPDQLPHALASRRAGDRRRSVRELSAALASLPTWKHRFGLLDDVFARWWEVGSPSSARVVRAWSELVRTGGSMPVRRLADEVGWSVRHVENRFQDRRGAPKARCASGRLIGGAPGGMQRAAARGMRGSRRVGSGAADPTRLAVFCCAAAPLNRRTPLSRSCHKRPLRVTCVACLRVLRHTRRTGPAPPPLRVVHRAQAL